MHGILIAIGPNLQYALEEDDRLRIREAEAPLPSIPLLYLRAERRETQVEVLFSPPRPITEWRESSQFYSRAEQRPDSVQTRVTMIPSFPGYSLFLPSFRPSVVHCATACGISSPPPPATLRSHPIRSSFHLFGKRAVLPLAREMGRASPREGVAKGHFRPLATRRRAQPPTTRSHRHN